MARRAKSERPPPRREFTVVIEQDADGWYVGSVPELPGCHTQARSLDKLMDRVREAIQAAVGEADDDNGGTFVGVQRIAV